MSILKVSTIQAALTWEDHKANLNNFDRLISSLGKGSDIIVLPEMFSTAYTMKPHKVAQFADQTIEWMRNKAASLESVITGSIVAQDNNQYFNRLIWMPPSGKWGMYDKRHLFGMAGEDKVYTPGTSRTIFEYKGWRILPLICYDLRFPVWSRYQEDYDMLIYVANWPVARVAAWKTLLQARAIENQCYTVGVNRVGEDQNNFRYSGSSCVIDYSGEPIYMASNQEQCAVSVLEKEKQDRFRAKLPFLNDRDPFKF